MDYKKINFEQTADGQSFASITLDGGCRVQILRGAKMVGNPPFYSHDCKLVNKRNSALDQEEGLDQDGVQAFLDRSAEMATEIAEELAAVAEMQAEAVS